MFDVSWQWEMGGAPWALRGFDVTFKAMSAYIYEDVLRDTVAVKTVGGGSTVMPIIFEK